MDKLYLSYDGDGCGKKVGRAIIANDEVALNEISSKIDLGHEIVNNWVAKQGGRRISGGGDEGAFSIPKESSEGVEALRRDYHYATGITISVGIGKSLSEAGRSLLAAKFRGKDQIAIYGKDVEDDIAKARKKVKKGRASQEEYKLAEAYLEKSEPNMEMNEESPCPYCEQTDGVDHDHCKYCHDLDTAAGEEDCPYCKEMDAAPAQGNQDPRALDAPGAAAELEAQACENNGLNPPQIGKPDPISANPETAAAAAESNKPLNPAQASADAGAAAAAGTGAPAGAGSQPPTEDTNGLGSEDNHSKEALMDIASQIESEGNPTQSAAAAVDDTALTGEPRMEGATNRPAGFEQNTPSDTGLGEENGGEPQEDSNPDLTAVLQEGLDSESGNIMQEHEKTRIVQVVSQALQMFKANKQLLEQSKAQSPQLYQGSLMILKAMIEMAKYMGLDSSGTDALGGPIGPQGEQAAGEDEWQDPFPAHPDQGGQEKPGHAAGSGAAAPAPQR